MQINLPIEDTLQQLLADALSPEALRPKIQKILQDTVDHAISSAFGRYGDFSKTLEPAIKALVPHALKLDEATSFDLYLKKAITERINTYNEERLKQVFGPLLDDLLERPPAEITLTDLVKKAAECWDADYRRKGADRVTVHVEDADSDGYWRLYLDPGTKSSYGSNYSCQVHLAVTKDGQVYSLKNSEGKVDMAKERFAGPFYGFESYLLALYTGNTKIVRDVSHEDDLYDAAQYPTDDGCHC
jgi:hypothetical protein